MKFDFISSIKELFFDIIGFFIPGFIVLFIINAVFKINLPFDLDSYISIILSYIFGYIVYSFSLIKSSLLCKKYKFFRTKSKDQIENELFKRDTIVLAFEYINLKVEKNGKKLTKLSSLRDVAMTQSPGSDKKIYTFMFRAELFDQLHTISIVALLTSIVLLFLSLIELYPKYVLFDYLMIGVFITLIFTLRKGWKRFFEIAMSLPFTLYIANQSHNETK